MKAYRKLTGAAAIFLVLLILTANVLTLHLSRASGKAYRVDISRAAREIRQEGLQNLDLSRYPSLVRVTAGAGQDFLQGGEEEYALREIEGLLYRFDYEASQAFPGQQLAILNLSLILAALFVLILLHVIGRHILKPFDQIKNMPEELARGNLTRPLQQQKSRYFGNFLWGLDLLREKLEQQKIAELKLQKEKKSLILSLTHDIKTPLSAIKLYSRALETNLYEKPEKQLEAAHQIGQKVEEIEAYIGKINRYSREDFLHLQVSNGEFYLKELETAVKDYYGEKLELLKIPCRMDFGVDCLLKGDRDRSLEILENMIENAIKYGDGREIRISASEEDGCRILTVHSQGCSLKPEELPHIFDSFWRGSNSSQVPGSGLGLYICRQLAAKMGGDIFARLSQETLSVSLVLPKA